MAKGTKIGTDQPKSIAGVLFSDIGLADAQPMLENVTPMQILLAGQFLLTLAERQLNEFWSENARQQQRDAAVMDEVLRSRL